ncbi:MAG: hypothetical protein QM723_14795 [Myxococcaceae bacterium]
MKPHAFALAALVLFACKPAPPPLQIPDGCQPLLDKVDCLLPYPSDFFLTSDASTASGKKLVIPPAAQLTAHDGKVIDFTKVAPADGFSRVNPIVFMFPFDPGANGTVRLEDDPDRSLDPSTSNTLLVNETTGEPVPHFVDIDPRATDGKRRAITMHPLVTMDENTRYAVFVHGFTNVDGAPLPAPEPFRRIRDDDTGGQKLLEPMKKAWQDRLEPLAKKLKLDPKQLELAWEFTTGSQDQATRDMLKVRELAIAWAAANTPVVTVTSVDTDVYTETWLVVHGTVTGPLFLDQPDPGARLFRNSSGAVAQNGTTVFDFVVTVPASVRDQFGPGHTLQYGHGFFGTLAELTGGSTRAIGNNTGRVMIGIDWWGMSTPDLGVFGQDATSNPTLLGTLPDRVHQAMANWIVTSKAIESVFPQLPELKRPASGEGVSVVNGVSNAGQPVLEPDASAFLGISEGHLLGATQCTLNPRVTRCSLMMGGAGFTHLMMRAAPFSSLFSLLEIELPDALDQQKFIALFQQPLDKIDGATWAQYTLSSELPGSPNPPRHVLLQMGLGDTEVPNLGTFMHARLLHIPVLQPSPASPYQLERANGPVDSALEIADYGINTAALYRVPDFPMMDTPVHEDLRQRVPTQQQLEHFWETGEVQHYCNGVCDPD